MNNIIKSIKKHEPKKLTSQQIKICFLIISILKKDEYVHMSYIQSQLKEKYYNFSRQTIRKYIQLIRERMVSKFQNPTGNIFLIADAKGYKLTDKQIILDKYFNVLKQRYKSLQSQILELELAMWNNERGSNANK